MKSIARITTAALAIALSLTAPVQGQQSADKRHATAMTHGLGDEANGVHQALGGALKVDNVDPVLGAVNVRAHLGVPTAGLMAKVHACGQQVAKRYVHDDVLLVGRPPQSVPTR